MVHLATTPRRLTRYFIAIFTLVAVQSSWAGMSLVAGPPGTHVGNLVVNGSFETGSPGPGAANTRFWATGTTQTPFAVPPGWSSAGQPSNYAFWGADTPPNRLRFSDNVVDGQVGMYFGNGLTTFDQPPTYYPDGTISFPATPNSSKGPPVQLWQSVPTHLTPAPSYLLDFWVSGEGAGQPNSYAVGIFGLKVTNVLPGDPTWYLQVPNGSGSFGASRRYEFSLTPLNSLSPVTVEFQNWGHVDLSAYGMGLTTEVVLDDVIVNAVPEPATLGLLGLGSVVMLQRRRGSAA